MVRLKHRYLLVNILYPLETPPPTKSKINEGEIPDIVKFRKPTPEKFKAGALKHLVLDGVRELFGEYGVGVISASLNVKYFSQATSTAIIRVSRDHYRLVWAALSLVTQLPRPTSVPCVFQVVRVSGTIRKSEEEAIKRARDMVRRAKMENETISLFGDLRSSSTMEGVEEGVETNDSDLESPGEDSD